MLFGKGFERPEDEVHAVGEDCSGLHGAGGDGVGVDGVEVAGELGETLV